MEPVLQLGPGPEARTATASRTRRMRQRRWRSLPHRAGSGGPGSARVGALLELPGDSGVGPGRARLRAREPPRAVGQPAQMGRVVNRRPLHRRRPHRVSLVRHGQQRLWRVGRAFGRFGFGVWGFKLGIGV